MVNNTPESAEQQQEWETVETRRGEPTREEEPEAKRFERITKQGTMEASQDEAVTERLETLAETGKPVTRVLDLQNISSTMSKTQIMWARAAIIRQGVKSNHPRRRKVSETRAVGQAKGGSDTDEDSGNKKPK
jgi:ATPase subunit of ABC transporter with duplicated ATPase domains